MSVLARFLAFYGALFAAFGVASPFLPGLLVMMFAPVIERKPMLPGQDPRGAWIAMGVTIALFAFLWWLNRRGARKLQKHIDDIDALTGGKE